MSQHKSMPCRHLKAHIRELQADLDTPLAIYLKVANVPNSYLFESIQGGEKWSRYSIIGLQSNETIQVFDRTIEHIKDGQVIERIDAADPLAWLETFNSQFQVDDSEALPRFCGGLVGYFGYETVRMIEPSIPKSDQADVLGVPDILLMVSTEVIVFDNLKGKMFVIIHDDKDANERAEARLDELEELLRTQRIKLPATKAPESINEENFSSSFDEEQFKQAVVKAKQYIHDGDVMQVVLSQRLSIDFSYDSLSLYRALRQVNPSPYMFYVNLGEFQIVGSSPEILVRLEDDQVTVRPIAGTRRRGRTEVEDKALEAELLADPKELAEHLMLIDLGRNDAGRVCQTGTVELTEKMAIERYSHVMHIVSNVVGEVDKKYNAFDVLRATFPAGTVSGAPKIRALTIIDELEPVKRGIYSGAVGYIGWNGNLDTAIAIRTAVIKNDKLYVQAGAGIVYDSQPELEWKETMNKARVIFKAVSLVAQGNIR